MVGTCVIAIDEGDMHARALALAVVVTYATCANAAANDLRTRVIAFGGIVNGYEWADPVAFPNTGVTLHNRFGASALGTGRVSMAVRGSLRAGLEVCGCRYRVIDKADLGAGQQIRQVRSVDIEYAGAVIEVEIARSDELHWTIVGAAGVGVAVQSWDVRVERNGVKIGGGWA